MRVLFLIPKANPPVLEGDFSPAFKDFISLCLTKNTSQRPSAKDLLQHRFIKSARRTQILSELVERYQEHRIRSPSRGSPSPKLATVLGGNDSMRSDWSFGTVAGAGGTLRVGKDGTIGFAEEGEDEDDEEWEANEAGADYGGSAPTRRRGEEDGSERSVQGSTVRGIVSLVPLSCSRCLHERSLTASVVILSFQPKGIDVPALLASSPHGSRTDFSEPTTPPTPPAHASSSMKRNSFARRHDINGTVVTEADLGTGYAHSASTSPARFSSP